MKGFVSFVMSTSTTNLFVSASKAKYVTGTGTSSVLTNLIVSPLNNFPSPTPIAEM